MSQSNRVITVGGAQLGPIGLEESRAQVVERLIALLEQAARHGASLVVFPELALTAFFPRWYFQQQGAIDRFFEREMPGPETRALFDRARALRIGFYLGYAELTEEAGETRRYNTAILVDTEGAIVGKYRKVHLPGHADHKPERTWQHLEKAYFDVGNLGFPVWRAMGGVMGMCICNDRRWPETYRVMGLKGVEMVMLGYNTPSVEPPWGFEPTHLASLHNNLSMQSGAYQNSTWVVGVAKAGREEGCDMLGGSMIVAPTGEIVAQARTLGDELIVADCDLDACSHYKNTVFNFAEHRQPDQYAIITAQAGATPPD
jgi:predicted amidohydrolase